MSGNSKGLVSSIITIQAHIRGWLARKKCQKLKTVHNHKQHIKLGLNFLQKRLGKQFLTQGKPPIYKKTPTNKQVVYRSAVKIQKHIRGYLQRKRFKPLLIEKMLKEQEDQYQSQILKIEHALTTDPLFSPNQNSVVYRTLEDSPCDLPLPISQRRFSPSKNKNLVKPVTFDFDLYILAATEIQRVFRGYKARAKLGGSFKRLREKVVKVQKKFRAWKERRSGQLEVAANLLSKHTNMIVSAFTSYNHLRSLVLSQDSKGKYSRFLDALETKLNEIGLKTRHPLTTKNEDLETKETQKLKEQVKFWKNKYKTQVQTQIKAVKALKHQLAITHKSNYEHLGNMVQNLATAKKELENEDFSYSTDSLSKSQL